MKHLGDITKISGHEAPVVDCVIGGSPCQGLSQAGLRKGLEDERSGLFIEQVRIVKEMRKEDERNGRSGVDIRPRYMVWENVPGSLSSPGKDRAGEDFRCVLEEVARIVEEGVTIPRPTKGKWSNTGVIVGDGYSIAWRIMDAQYFGVPQRRRRIALVADFGGYTAPRIVFGEGESHGSTVRDRAEPSLRNTGGESRPEVQSVSEGLPRNTYKGKQTREGTPYAPQGSLGADDRLGADQYNGVILGDTASTLGVNFGMSHGRQCVLEHQAVYYDELCLDDQGGQQINVRTDGKAPTLRAETHGNLPRVVYSVENHPNDSRVGINEDGKVQALTSRMGTGGGNVPMVMQTYSKEAVVYALDRASFNQGKNAQYDFEISDNGVNSPLVAKGPGAVCYGINGDKAGTLDSSYFKGCGMRSGVEREVVAVAVKTRSCCYAVDCRNATEDTVNGALRSNSAHSLNGNNAVRTRYIVRRLTPLECERLQGFPDYWTSIGEYTDGNGKRRKTSDANRYKALGNSIALPPWKALLKRLCACYERDATMASLFDGIGGFPLLWEQINGKGSCLWASEIEEFPIAVTKRRIGE